MYIGLRRSLFELVLVFITTEFSTVIYNDWNGFAIFIMTILIIIGGGAGSTEGGMKLYRVYVLCGNCIWNIKETIFITSFGIIFWTEIVGMLLGHLEIWVIIIAIIKISNILKRKK